MSASPYCHQVLVNCFYDTRPDELSRFLDATSAETYEVAALKQGEDITL